AMPGALYRVRQFLSALRARPLQGDDLRLVQAHLPSGALDLFLAMPPGDQRHSLIILRALLARGYTAEPLLQAALLHDAAKARIDLWHRTVVILLNSVSRAALPRLASADPNSWRYPFYLSVNHPQLGAAMAERAGADPRSVLLIREHQPGPDGADPAKARLGPELVEWHQALKALDDLN
ncbi:MAG: hypothetical protein ACM3JD_05105, partial [Rudaea sp.]